MLASGNGKIETCIQNLLKIPRGSIPYERMKGINPDLIDKPASIGTAEYVAAADWVINAYEPRASGVNINLTEVIAKLGQYGANVKIEK